MVNDNVVDVIVRPGAKAGEPAAVELRPETPFVQVDARVDTVGKGGRDCRSRPAASAPERFVVRGQIPVDVEAGGAHLPGR